MEYKGLTALLFNALTYILESKTSLFIFASEHAHFEGWVKVEICEILSKNCSKISPEKDSIDLTFDNWLLELKTISTGYKYDFVKNKGSRKITEKVKSVVSDINKLKKKNKSMKKWIVFIVYPNEHKKPQWQDHLAKVKSLLKELKYNEFKFKDKIPGVIYSGLVE